MKVAHAFWEDSVLNTKTFEVVLENGDTVEAFSLIENELITRDKARYIVVKTPANEKEMIAGLPVIGYRFVEAMITLSLKKKNHVVPKFVSLMDHRFRVKKISSGYGEERLYKEVLNGTFDTDRVSVDDRFSSGKAGERYVNWIRDLLKKNEHVYEVLTNDNKMAPIGFFVFRHVDDKKADGVLTGLYKKYAMSGFGPVLAKKNHDILWDLNYENFIARVSSNNVTALRLNLIFGFDIEEINYTYTKMV